jgi:hypothetical protein
MHEMLTIKRIHDGLCSRSNEKGSKTKKGGVRLGVLLLISGLCT